MTIAGAGSTVGTRGGADAIGGEILWLPSPDGIQRSNMTRFARMVGLEDEPYEVLHRWSIAEPGAFWGALWDFSSVVGERGTAVFEPASDGGMLAARWFPEARLNFAETCSPAPVGRWSSMSATRAASRTG